MMALVQSRKSASSVRRGSTVGLVFLVAVVALSLLVVLLQKVYIWIQQFLSVQCTTYQEVIMALESQGCGLTGLIQILTFIYRTARPFVIQMYAKHA